MNQRPRPCHPLELRVPPLLLVAIIGSLTWIGARATAPMSFDFTARPLVAAGLAGLGFIFSLLGVASFRRARTTVDPTKPEAATTLVVSGAYRITRNPMYLGFLLFLGSEAVWLSHPIALAGMAAFVAYMNRFQIAPEESALKERFGAAYFNYTKRVRRWI